MTTPLPGRGLYVITDPGLIPGPRLVPTVAEAIDGGAVMVQYRDKGQDRGRRRREASELLALCRQRGVPLIINDDLRLAVEIEADGVHLGRDDVDLNRAREVLRNPGILGISCYNEPERALKAQAAGADYVAFGRFFPSRSKPGAVGAGLEMLRSVRGQIEIPVVAIGGITLENGALLLEAGADLLAAIHGVFGGDDPQAAARRYTRLFRQAP